MSVFRSLLGKQDRRRQIKAYVRDDGPIAYNAPLLFGLDPETPLDQALFSAGLCWYWERTSAYATDDAAGDSAFPGARPLTRLTSTTYPDFVADLKKQRTGEIDRSMRLYGLQPAEGYRNFDSTARDDAVRRFVNNEEGPLQIICILVRDAGFQNEDESFEGIFVRHEISDPIRRLLLRLGIDPDQPQESLPYWHLWSTSLEFIFDVPKRQTGPGQEERFLRTGEVCLLISTDAERRAFRDRIIAQILGYPPAHESAT